MEDLSKIELFVRGRPIATMEEMQAYAYAVPEDQTGPAIVTGFICGDDVDPGQLHRALVCEARSVVAENDGALEIILTVAGRLRKAFPNETA